MTRAEIQTKATAAAMWMATLLDNPTYTPQNITAAWRRIHDRDLDTSGAENCAACAAQPEMTCSYHEGVAAALDAAQGKLTAHGYQAASALLDDL